MIVSFLILKATEEEEREENEPEREKEKERENAPVALRTRGGASRRNRSAPVVSPAKEIAPSADTGAVDSFMNDDRGWQEAPEMPDIPVRTRGRQRVTLGNLLAPSRSRLAITGRVDEDLVAGLTGAPGYAGLQARALLGNMESRGHIPLVTPDELQLRGEDRLLNCRGDTRWKDLQSVWKAFLVWSRVWLDLYYEQQLTHTYMIINFLESKMATVNPKTGRVLGKSSAHRYLKDLRQIARSSNLEVENETLDAYSSGLARDGARAPAHQAPPATRADIDATRQYLTPSEYVGMELARKTASRIGEMEQLNVSHVTPVSDGVWQVTFPYHKGDPFRLGTVITIYPDESLRKALERLHTMPPDTPITDLTTSRAAAVLGRVRPGLTAHSVKRGALVDLLNAGVPLSLIQVIAKHKDLETLLIYLPKVSVAMALGLHEATRTL